VKPKSLFVASYRSSFSLILEQFKTELIFSRQYELRMGINGKNTIKKHPSVMHLLFLLLTIFRVFCAPSLIRHVGTITRGETDDGHEKKQH